MKSPILQSSYALGVLFTLVFYLTTFAQVGIGTTSPNADALLDVDATTTNGGILLPRIALTNTSSPSPLSADVAGMIVYNTANTGDVSPGFYYNDGTDWIRLGAGSESDDWKTTGNSGTSLVTHFIGTTDAQPVVLKANNIEKVRIDISETVINEDSNTYNFRVESDNLTNALFIDGTNDAVGIGTSTPSNYSGVAVDRFTVIGGGTTTVVGPNTAWTPVSAFINEDEGVALYVHNESTTDTGAALESGVEGPGFGVRALHLATSGAGYAVYGSTNSPVVAWAGYFNGDVGGTAFYQVSDKKWKKNITKLNTSESMLDKIMLLNATSYQWKVDEFPGMSFKKEETSFGFIAQELKEVFPELVSTKQIPDPTVPVKQNQSANLVDGFHLVNYTGLIPVLTQAIQEQQEIIITQNDKIQSLEREFEQLKQDVINLKNNK